MSEMSNVHVYTVITVKNKTKMVLEAGLGQSSE